MNDKFKTLIKDLSQPIPDHGSVDQLVAKIIKRELNLLWEKRISIFSAIFILILGYLTIRQIVAVANWLDTMGFWGMVSADSNWLLNDAESFWPAFLEANPLKEIGFLLLLVFLLTFSVTIFLKASNKRGSFMRKSNIAIPLAIFLMVVTVATAVWIFSAQRKAIMPTGLGEVKEPVVSPTNLPLPSQIETTPKTEATPTLLPTGVKPQPFFLELTAPKEGTTVNVGRIEVAGRTNPDSEVFVNEEQVYPDQNGNFYKGVTLQEGENYIVVTAGNEQGDSEIERVVFYEE